MRTSLVIGMLSSAVNISLASVTGAYSPSERCLRRSNGKIVEIGVQNKKIMSQLVYDAYTNAMENEMSYCELKRREVINGSDGRRMGHIIDLVFSVADGKIKGIILPYGKRGVFSKAQDLFVPWQCVQKIGEDVILVEIRDMPGGPTCVPSSGKPERLPESPPKKNGRNCDGKCEKCMLFDCANRWNAAAE